MRMLSLCVVGTSVSSQTMNLIEMVLDFADLKFYDALIRVSIFIGYGIAIVAKHSLFRFTCLNTNIT